MIYEEQLPGLAGKTVHGPGGQKIGKITDVYESTDSPEGTFVTVSTGLFGTSSSFVPLAEARLEGDDVVVPYDKDLVKSAPRVDDDEELSAEEEERLYRHYHLTGSGTAGTAGTAVTETSGTTGTVGTVTATAGEAAGAAGGGATAALADADRGRGTVGHDTSGRTTDDAMTRSEERLRVGTQQVETGRVRLRKRIVTQTETRTVPVSHEEVHLVREPITDGQPVGGIELAEQEVEVTLQAERAVVSKETVPVERVRLDTETVTERQTVTEQVRKEQIEVEGDVRPDGRTR